MTSTFTAALAFKRALYAAAGTLSIFNDSTQPVLLTYDEPAFDVYDDVVSFGETSIQQDPAAVGSMRPREEILQQTVTFACFKGGGQEAAETTMNRAWALLEPLEFYCRMTDTELGGAVRTCFLFTATGDGLTPDEVLSKGRLYTLNATFRAENRVTS